MCLGASVLHEFMSTWVASMERKGLNFVPGLEIPVDGVGRCPCMVPVEQFPGRVAELGTNRAFTFPC